MKSFKLILLITIFALITVAFSEKTETESEEDSTEKIKNEKKQELTFMQKVALTRDWFGREDPNNYPARGFFPVWPFLLLTIAVFCLLLAIISGLFHILGCKGKRPSGEKRQLIN